MATSRRQSRRGTAEGHLRSFTAALRRTPVHTRTSSVPTSQPAEEAYRYNELLALVSNDRPARGHERHHPPTDHHCRRRPAVGALADDATVATITITPPLNS
jgi:hypothetical protein